MSDKATEATAKKKSKQTKPSKFLMSLLSIFVTLLAVMGLFYLWEDSKQQYRTYSSELVKQQEQQQQLDKNIQQLNEQSKENEASIERILEKNSQYRGAWELFEASYLLKLANYHVQYFQDHSTIMSLLEQADGQLAKTSLIQLKPIRQKIADALLNLQSHQQPDVAGLLHKLSALNKQFAKLTQNLNIVHAENPGEHADSNSDAPGWKQALTGSMKQLIVVRKHDAIPTAFLTDDQKSLLQQHIDILIAQAGWAVAHKDSASLKFSMNQLDHVVQNYFVAQGNELAGVEKTIHEIAGTPLMVAYPNIELMIQNLQTVILVQNKQLNRKA